MDEILEIEIKAACDDLNAVKEMLILLGATSLGESVEIDRYFNHPCRDFHLTDEALRIRRKEGRARITYKGPRLGIRGKTRYEKEVYVDEPESLEDVLFKLGFTDAGTVRKKRDMFRLKDIEISLDMVDEVGNYVELEIRGLDKEKGEEKLFMLAHELDLHHFERKTYLELKYASR